MSMLSSELELMDPNKYSNWFAFGLDDNHSQHHHHQHNERNSKEGDSHFEAQKIEHAFSAVGHDMVLGCIGRSLELGSEGEQSFWRTLVDMNCARSKDSRTALAEHTDATMQDLQQYVTSVMGVDPKALEPRLLLPSERGRVEKLCKGTRGGAGCCMHCGTTVTTMWRKVGDKTMCNACALYQRLHGVGRPMHLHSGVVRRRNRGTRSSTKSGKRA